MKTLVVGRSIRSDLLASSKAQLLRSSASDRSFPGFCVSRDCPAVARRPSPALSPLPRISASMWSKTTAPSIVAVVGISTAALLLWRGYPRGFHATRGDRCLGEAAKGQCEAAAAEEGDFPGHEIHVRGRDSSSLTLFEGQLSENDRVLLRREHSGRDASTGVGFNFSQFFSSLTSNSVGRVLIFSEVLPSTQTLMFKEMESEQDGIVCVAARQRSGRGRGSNQWNSPEGCLTFSFSTSVTDAASLPFFQYLVSMAVYQTVSKMTGGDARQTIGLELKWPNDVYGPNKMKIGGVLCESKVKMSAEPGRSPSFYVVAGVGINFFNSEPTTCLLDMLASNGFQDLSSQLSKEAFLALFCQEFEDLLDVLKVDGFLPLRDKYTSMWMHTGQTVQVLDDHRGKHNATIVGIAPSGFLMAEDHQGTVLELHPDGNSLDMMKGLISRKIPRPMQ